MTDTLRPGPDFRLNRTLEAVYTSHSEGPLATDTGIAPGLHLHADPALELGGSWHSPAGRLLDLEAKAAGAGGWLGLHFDMDAPDLAPYGILGLACRIAAPRMHNIRICLRSGQPDGFRDCFFDKPVLVPAEESVHLDALVIEPRADLPFEASWRELILFLPTEDFSLSLRDLRVFAV